ncbi:hypothetical protein G7054_g3827 [Neopestalotiopsis clavispora]|nr:hypothetical protein G7054_g3827 [Neopestalotiopsis clavispora]
MYLSKVISFTLVACSAPVLAQCPAETDNFTSAVAQIVLSMSHNPATWVQPHLSCHACTVATEAVGAGRIIQNEIVAGNISVDSVAYAIDTALGNLKTFFAGNDTVELIISSMIKMIDELRVQADTIVAGTAKASGIITGLSNILGQAGTLAKGVSQGTSTASTSAAGYKSVLSDLNTSMTAVMSEILQGASTGCISAMAVSRAVMQGADQSAMLLDMVTGGGVKAEAGKSFDLLGAMQDFQAFLQS